VNRVIDQCFFGGITAGLRPVQIWVPDTRRPDFAQECRRQCMLVAGADGADRATQQLMDEALADLDGWTE
jgi:hypothetical protein